MSRPQWEIEWSKIIGDSWRSLPSNHALFLPSQYMYTISMAGGDGWWELHEQPSPFDNEYLVEGSTCCPDPTTFIVFWRVAIQVSSWLDSEAKTHARRILSSINTNLCFHVMKLKMKKRWSYTQTLRKRFFSRTAVANEGIENDGGEDTSMWSTRPRIKVGELAWDLPQQWQHYCTLHSTFLRVSLDSRAMLRLPPPFI